MCGYSSRVLQGQNSTVLVLICDRIRLELHEKENHRSNLRENSFCVEKIFIKVFICEI